MSYGYCQSQIEGSKKCKEQCDNCKEYYKPLETKLKLEKELAKVEKELDKCRTTTIEDGWQTQRHAKKARKWDYYAQYKMKLLTKLNDL